MSQMRSGILVGSKKGQITDTNSNMDASQTASAKLKKPNTKAIYCINLFV